MLTQEGGQGPPPINENVNKKTENRPTNLYSNTDKGPYELFVESSKDNLGNYSFLSIAKNILNLKLEGIKDIKKRGKNRIGIVVDSGQRANELIVNNSFKQLGLEAYIPYNRTSVKGVVKYVDKNFTEEELLQFTKVDNREIKIREVKRITIRDRRSTEIKYVPSLSVIFTFTGINIPREVKICGIPFRVVPYIGPVLQCFNCLLYGHTKKRCKGKMKCNTCSKHQHEGSCDKYCIFCRSTEHSSIEKKCPEFERQKTIKYTMAVENITYYEAMEKFPRPNKEFYNRSEDFPSLHKYNPPNQITIPERRLAIPVTPRHSTYKEAMSPSTSDKRKRKIPRINSFDREEENSILIAPNGRWPTNRSAPYNLQTPNSNNVRDLVHNESEGTLIGLIARLSEEQKQHLINTITQTILEGELFSRTEKNISEWTPPTNIFDDQGIEEVDNFTMEPEEY